MADNNNVFKAFGFELKRVQNTSTDNDKSPSIVPKVDEDGAGYVTASGSYFGQYVDMEGTAAKDNQELIKKYRGMAEHCLLYTSPSPRDVEESRMPSSA